MKRESGMTLVEVLVSLAIVAVIISMSSVMISTAMRGTQNNINKQFASQKATAMLEELRALVQTQSSTSSVVLDDYDDGTTNQVLLTTQRGITDPAAPASGNTRVEGHWLFERRISVQRIPGTADLRIVNVKVFVNEANDVRLLAEVAGVISTIGQNMPPTQVYDVYLVAVENVPGWWLHMQNIRTFVDDAMADLEARHPGLSFRRHWIRKLSYGRDPYYTPYVNDAADSTNPIDSVYFYPGKMPDGSATEKYYPADVFSAQISVDGTVKNGYDEDENPLPYTLADQYNNSMRYMEEVALFNARAAAGLEDPTSPTLRLLLDDMIMRPRLYTNAIIINLHGELFPFPPVRNYSDAAKLPDVLPNVRVVTHPERLHYGNADPITLRVYSYHTNVTSPGSVPEWLGRDGTPVPITLTFRNMNWTPNPGDIGAITGGVDFDGDGNPDEYSRDAASTTATTNGMWYSSQRIAYPDGHYDTILRLYNSPLKTPCANSCNDGGLDASARLYGLEYIPSPLEDVQDPAPPAPFTRELEANGTNPKNTARWVITVPPAVLSSNMVFSVETRIGDDTASSFPNLSQTYAWRGTDLWLFGDATHDANLPMTERFQVLGDPRHCPYADLKMPHGGSGRGNQDVLGMGYNRYFDDFHAPNGSGGNRAGRWPGWAYDAPYLSGRWYGIKNNASDTTNNNDGWDTGSGMLEIDVPRIYQILRTAVVRAHAVYTTMTGFSYYYVGIGGEIGYDASNGFPNSIPVSNKPFNGGGGWRYEQAITNDSSGGVKYVRDNANGNYWWAMSWLGEIVPDSSWATWTSTGNLPAGTGAGTFSRVLRGSITTRLPEGTVLQNAVRRTQEEGSTTFFWSGSASSTFHHRYQDNTDSTIASDGTDIANTYELPLPPTIDSSRPFNINVNDSSMTPQHFLQAPYGPATTLQALAEFYHHSTGNYGSALLAMRDGSDSAFVAVNGLSPAGEAGVSFISRWSFLTLIQSFLASGRYTVGGTLNASRVRELPRVAITFPSDANDLDNPSTINVTWQTQWRRWDGLPYTPAYPANFTEDTTIRFAVLYSRDNGRTWRFMSDDAVNPSPGVRPDSAHLQTATSFSWAVPAASFPKGNYVIRIEAYRDEVPLHYAFHQYRAFIKR